MPRVPFKQENMVSSHMMQDFLVCAGRFYSDRYKNLIWLSTEMMNNRVNGIEETVNSVVRMVNGVAGMVNGVERIVSGVERMSHTTNEPVFNQIYHILPNKHACLNKRAPWLQFLRLYLGQYWTNFNQIFRTWSPGQWLRVLFLPSSLARLFGEIW